jgi:hypothetical protein
MILVDETPNIPFKSAVRHARMDQNHVTFRHAVRRYGPGARVERHASADTASMLALMAFLVCTLLCGMRVVASTQWFA